MLTECIQAVITAITSLAGGIVANAGSIITAPVIGIYSLADQQAVFTALSQVRSAPFSKANKKISVSSLTLS